MTFESVCVGLLIFKVRTPYLLYCTGAALIGVSLILRVLPAKICAGLRAVHTYTVPKQLQCTIRVVFAETPQHVMMWLLSFCKVRFELRLLAALHRHCNRHVAI